MSDDSDSIYFGGMDEHKQLVNPDDRRKQKLEDYMAMAMFKFQLEDSESFKKNVERDISIFKDDKKVKKPIKTKI